MSRMASANGTSSGMHHKYPVLDTKTPPADVKPQFVRLFFHVGVLAVMVNGFMGLNGVAVNNMIQAQYGGHLLYLTIIGLFASQLVLFLSALKDLLPAVKFLRTLKRSVLLFALPVEMVISSIYWPLVLLKPDLMFPASPGAGIGEPTSSDDLTQLFRIPLWMDLSLHAVPALTLFIDFWFLEPNYKPPASTQGALALAVTAGTVYSTWIEHAAKINGSFPYPFLTIMDFSQRVAMYVVATAMAFMTFRGLNSWHPSAWSKRR